MFLSDSELYELTGMKKNFAQRRALRQMGIHHWVRPDGKPIVLKEDLLQSKPRKTATPNWDAL